MNASWCCLSLSAAHESGAASKLARRNKDGHLSMCRYYPRLRDERKYLDWTTQKKQAQRSRLLRLRNGSHSPEIFSRQVGFELMYKTCCLIAALLGLSLSTASAHDIITTKLTYTRDISRIFNRRCVSC